jgi:gliding motility-associated-like protein
MCPRKLIFVLLLFLLCNKLSAATFTVTSNADSGPGTLRQALLDAASNGTATTDMITFNLPGAGQPAVTITLQTQLPDITANVIIDGTTQPGLPLGISNAKIVLTPVAPAANLNCLNVSTLVGATDVVGIYGLYIFGFSPTPGLGDAIISNASCQLTIGAPGKGNVICGNEFALIGSFQNAVIQSNFIGVGPDGESVFDNTTVLFSAQGYNNLIIGGATQQDGNVIIGGTGGGINLGGGANTTIQSVLIENNLFNTDYAGIKPLGIASNSCILVNDPNTSMEVFANVFSASELAISGINHSEMVVTGNFFGTDRTQTFALSSGVNAIQNSGFVGAIIGGTTPVDQNVFTNYQNPINCYNNSITDVIQNIFYCNTEVQLNDLTGKNFIRITTLTNNSVGGDAPPGAQVQLYYTDTKCSATCNPYACFATIMANSNGKWQYTGSQPLNILASSTVLNNTVGFQFDSLAQDEVTITNYDCHHSGSVVLKEQRQGNFQYLWTDNAGKTVATTQNLSNVAAGTYILQLSENGSCPSVSNSFTIINVLPVVYSQSAQLDCDNPTATFTSYPSTGPGITVTNYYWEDSRGNILSNTNTVSGLAAGTYYLYVTDSNGCTSNKATITVTPAIDAPVINDDNAMVNNATCGNSNGSVTGITLTNSGTANYGWSTAAGAELDPGQLNLTNAAPGEYYFYVYYDFNCPPIKSKTFTIINTIGVTLDDNQAVITPSTCANSNGGIGGVIVTGANSYQWFNSANPDKVVGYSAILQNVPAGDYYLVASNGTCSVKSTVLTVTNFPAFNNFPSTSSIVNASCSQANGSVTVSFTTGTVPSSYRWADVFGNTLVTNGPLQNVPAGAYKLYVTDINGCESLYNSYTISESPLIQINAASARILSDQCLHGVGSIGSIQITGGIPPFTYLWLDAGGNVAGTSLYLTNLHQGVYTLQVRDDTQCGLATQQFTVPNDTAFVATPNVPPVQICNAGQAVIFVKNPLTGYGYHLYASATSIDTLETDASGLFTVNVSKPETFYVTQYTGNCESARVPVNITITLIDLMVPNTFTPNNDGINDYWNIKGIESYNNVEIQIFTRYGQKVFDSKGYATPFDGNYGNSKLPPGVYYYIINLNSNCNLISGSLTLIR